MTGDAVAHRFSECFRQGADDAGTRGIEGDLIESAMGGETQLAKFQRQLGRERGRYVLGFGTRAPRGGQRQSRPRDTGQKTCIDCHKGIAHRLPDMRNVPGWQ